MFLSVFFGVFFAVMASAGALYYIKEYQDEASAKEVLRQADSQTEHRPVTHEHVFAPKVEPAQEQQPIEFTGDPVLAQSVSLKTPDGNMIIPAGKSVHMVNEKSAPGTVMINYEGYTFSVPIASLASASR